MMTFDPNWECKHGVALELNRTCMQCAEERGYQRGLAERDAELATAKARIVALGVEGDEMDQKHLDELRECDDGLHDLSVAKDAAEAKLATAVECLRSCAELGDEAIFENVSDTLRALGIDPSKEQEQMKMIDGDHMTHPERLINEATRAIEYEDCGHTWQRRERYAWWPIRIHLHCGEIQPAAMHGSQIGWDGIEQRVFARHVRIGPVIISFGRDERCKP